LQASESLKEGPGKNTSASAATPKDFQSQGAGSETHDPDKTMDLEGELEGIDHDPQGENRAAHIGLMTEWGLSSIT